MTRVILLEICKRSVARSSLTKVAEILLIVDGNALFSFGKDSMNRMPALQLLMKMSTNDYSLLQRFWIPKLAFSSFSKLNTIPNTVAAVQWRRNSLQRNQIKRDSDETNQTEKRSCFSMYGCHLFQVVDCYGLPSDERSLVPVYLQLCDTRIYRKFFSTTTRVPLTKSRLDEC